MASSNASLETGLHEYRTRIEQIESLYKDTEECFRQLQGELRRFSVAAESEFPIPSLSKDGLFIPSVIVIGNQNCGKSTFLNVLLKGKHLPVHENPCTSRIVRISYSESNFVQLVDEAGNVIQREKFKRKVPKKYAVLSDAAKESADNLSAIVEVGVEHEFLQSGIELIDSPGRCESDALDRLVDGFLEKGIVPLIVYVVDGNEGLNRKDKETIRELHDKLPETSLLFVCSKVDVDDETLEYDHDSDTEEENPLTVSRSKMEKVFKQLKKLGVLKQDADISSCSDFHGISSTRVQKARKNCEENDATNSFENLKLCIYDRLRKSLESKCRQAISSLLSALEIVLALTTQAHKDIALSRTVVSKVFENAVEAGKSLLYVLIDITLGHNAISDDIGKSMRQMTVELLDDAETYQVPDGKTVRLEFQTITGPIAELTQHCGTEELLYLDFIHNMKSTILEKTFSTIRMSLDYAIQNRLSQAISSIVTLAQNIQHPFIARLLARSYMLDTEALTVENNFEGIHHVLDGLLEVIHIAVSKTLREEIALPFCDFQLNEVSRRPRPRDNFWRRKVAQTLLSKLDSKKISDSAIKTCKEILNHMLEKFVGRIETIKRLNDTLASIPDDFDNLRLVHVPHVAELVARGYSLQNIMNKGPVKLGAVLSRTANSVVYECSSPAWGGLDKSVVKVVKRDALDDKVWKQCILDGVHTLDIMSRLGGKCPVNHLRLFGWCLLPPCEEMYIVMERVRCDLLTALQEGLSWEQRLTVAKDVARGLQKIHKAEYVYRDLKPQNVMISFNGCAKINMCKPEKPFEITKLGLPFHISPEMYKRPSPGSSSSSFDIYAFGSLWWVICEGTGNKRPRAFEFCHDSESMEQATLEGKWPERPQGVSDASWDLMVQCWKHEVTIDDVLQLLERLSPEH